VQLWHTGRVSHTSFQQDGGAPVGPSAIRANTKTFVAGEGFVDVSMPRALDLAEISGIIGDFRNAARRAIDAGFDGVEIHGANGYLLDAFLRNGTNHRTDRYGGSVENRARLLAEVTEACAAEIGADRLGVRISPVTTAGDSRDSHPQALFNHVVEALNRIGLAYVHVIEGDTGGARDNVPFDYAALHDRFDGAWMVNNGYNRKMAMDAVSQGFADLVSFGRLFMANPDLVRRLTENAPLNALMAQDTFYGGGAHGYTDYPFLDPKSSLPLKVEPTAA
jgi:N-ethylmaleimide reductase